MVQVMIVIESTNQFDDRPRESSNVRSRRPITSAIVSALPMMTQSSTATASPSALVRTGLRQSLRAKSDL